MLFSNYKKINYLIYKKIIKFRFFKYQFIYNILKKKNLEYKFCLFLVVNNRKNLEEVKDILMFLDCDSNKKKFFMYWLSGLYLMVFSNRWSNILEVWNASQENANITIHSINVVTNHCSIQFIQWYFMKNIQFKSIFFFFSRLLLWFSKFTFDMKKFYFLFKCLP